MSLLEQLAMAYTGYDPNNTPEARAKAFQSILSGMQQPPQGLLADQPMPADVDPVVAALQYSPEAREGQAQMAQNQSAPVDPYQHIVHSMLKDPRLVDQGLPMLQRMMNQQMGAASANNDPALVREYQFAKQNGYQGTFMEYIESKKSGGYVASDVQKKQFFDQWLAANPNATPEQIKAYADQLGIGRYYDTETSFVNPATGAELDKNVSEAEGRKIVGRTEGEFVADMPRTMRAYRDSMYEFDNTLDKLADLSGMTDYTTTGFGSWLSGIPMTDAKTFENVKTSILSRFSIDKIGEMKQQSKTGATGFGALSERELDLLLAYYNKLDQAASPRDIKRAIEQMATHINRMKRTMTSDAIRSLDRYDKLAPDYTDDPLDTNVYRDVFIRPQPMAEPQMRPQAPARQAMGGYTIGHQESGYEYIGGDPKDPNSWRAL